MTRGKYSARTANREAARDNELIAARIEEIAGLNRQLVEAQRSLARERAERGAMVIARADELSAEQIRLAREDAEATVSAQKAAMMKVAEYFCEFFHQTERYPDRFIEMVMPTLVSDPVKRAEMVDAVFEQHPDNPDGAIDSNRRVRRTGERNMIRESKKSRTRDGGVDLLVRKGILPEESLQVKAAPFSERGLV